MFLRERATQAEYFDSPQRSPSEVAGAYRELARINRLFCFSEPFRRLIPQRLGERACESLSILDLGAGDGSLGRALESWAARRSWRWKVTNLDINPLALRLGKTGRGVAGSVTGLPFRDQSFDVVIASQMTHHLPSDAEVCRHFQEAWRVTRDLLLLNDLHRNAALYFVIACVLRAPGFSRPFREDGLLSIRRAWRIPEWRQLARRAGIPGARVFLYYGARIFLEARREGPSPSGKVVKTAAEALV